MESERVRNSRTICLIQKQQERKHLTKHFPCYNLFNSYLLRFSPSTRFSPFIQQNKCQVMFLFCLSASTLPLLQNPSVNIFRTESLPQHQKTEVNLWKLYRLRWRKIGVVPTTTWMRYERLSHFSCWFLIKWNTFPRSRTSFRDRDWFKKCPDEFVLWSILSENLSKYKL